ncbi:MAG: peptide chain release factor N(5)-glutamine methyltransferase [Thermodesulfobacteriota bacterium]
MAKEAWTILKLIDWTTNFFKDKGISNPRLDTEVLLTQTLKLDRVGLYLNYDKPLTDKELFCFKELVKRRATREPLQYITGIQEFWSLEFRVGPGVLIPRPDTEILVEETLKEARGMEQGARGKGPDSGKIIESKTIKKDIAPCSMPLILDLCTGCGCIAVSLAKEFTNSIIYAIDTSEAALNIASQNAAIHKVADRITFLHGNLFEPLKGLKLFLSEGKGMVVDSFDIVVSNPPYVRSEDIGTLDPEIKDFEPISALDGGRDGLEVIRSIVRWAPDYLKKEGLLIMEIAFDQAKDIEYIINEKQAYNSVSVLKDYSGKDRVVKARVSREW